MTSKAAEKLGTLFARWKDEHRTLDTHLAELCQWFHSQEKSFSPPLVQATRKLEELQRQLQQHFTNENELGRLLAEARGTSTVEIESVCHKHDGEHANLLERLEHLIQRTSEGVPQLDYWEEVVRDFELFVDTIEQHEEQEAASVGWLLP